MRALILAAGMGKRLSWNDGPKALVPLLGLPLITRAILIAKEAGIRELVVVVGYEGDLVRETLGDGASLGVSVTYVKNEEWERGNGLSVLKAQRALSGERFLILMSDHVLDAGVVRRMTRSRTPRAAAMAVDVTVEDEEVIEEATRVLVEDNRVRSVGRGLSRYNGVDMGVILAGGLIFGALESAIREGREELGDALDILAGEERLQAVKFRHPFWFDIDTMEGLMKAKDALLRSLVKPEDGPVSRHLNRRISARITEQLVKTSLTPNQVSSIAFAVALVASVLFYLGDYLFLVVGGILVQFSSILDGCDGEVARLKFSSTSRGGWIDSLMDRYADFLLIVALAYGQWTASPQPQWWFGVFLALMGSYGVSYTAAAFRSAGKGGLPPGPQIPAKRDSRLLILALAAVLNIPLYGLIIIGLLGNAEVVRRLIYWK
ncbi:MAG: NTP transferase domain-containing protein [Thermoplasmata archaeon]